MSALIRLKDLTFSYNKGKENQVDAIKHVSLEIEKGDFVGIIGVSGSGKSTLLYLLAGLLKPDSGEYLYGDTDIAKISENRKADLRNSEFGFILQDFGLEGDRTALENVCLPLIFSKCSWGAMEKKGRAVMEKLNIADLCNKKVSQLSGGQCQRVAIARALVHEPRVILADEPTGALDSENKKILMHLLSEINREGITVIMVTHDISILSECNKIYKLNDGEIALVNETADNEI